MGEYVDDCIRQPWHDHLSQETTIDGRSPEMGAPKSIFQKIVFLRDPSPPLQFKIWYTYYITGTDFMYT